MNLLLKFSYCSSQNDLVHGWGLDFALRRCVEVLGGPYSHLSVLFINVVAVANCFPDPSCSCHMRKLELLILNGLIIKVFLHSATRCVVTLLQQCLLRKTVLNLSCVCLSQGQVQNGKPAWAGVQKICLLSCSSLLHYFLSPN